jgi:O-antigen/teichoic acid export membrane protein
MITVPVIVLTDNPILVVAALFASQSFFNAILLARTVKQKENDETAPEAISFGKNLTVMGAVSLFANQVDKIILWKFFGPIPLALYSFAQMPINQIEGAVPVFFLALPKIGERKIKDIKEGIIKKFKKLFYVFVPLTFMAIVLAPLFYRIVFPEYLGSVPYFQAFSLLLLFSPFLLFSASLFSEMKKKEIYIIQIITPFSRIFLFLILIPFFGIWGVIAAVIASQLIGGILSFYFFQKL